ncbi:MAG: dockerin type I domain-containing protein, partial [Aeoliella sp.]
FYRFSITEPSRVTVELSPVGPAYEFTPENGGIQSFNASAQSDLSLELYDSDGVLSIAQTNLTGVGESETLSAVELTTPGDYVIRVSGEQNRNQFYQLALAQLSDVGDYNNDGQIDAGDYIVWRNTLGTEVFPGTAADGNGDGHVGVEDYLTWKDNFGQASGLATTNVAVPEPGTWSAMLIVILLGLYCRIGPALFGVPGGQTELSVDFPIE